MGHNTHYVVVNAKTAEDAIDNVETALSGWGNENNWRYFLGAVCADGTVYESKMSHRGDMLSRCNTLEKINSVFVDIIKKEN